MKQHKDKVVVIRALNAVRTTTLCGRMNKQSHDGMNIADTDEEVTCKFCLKLMGFEA